MTVRPAPGTQWWVTCEHTGCRAVLSVNAATEQEALQRAVERFSWQTANGIRCRNHKTAAVV